PRSGGPSWNAHRSSAATSGGPVHLRSRSRETFPSLDGDVDVARIDLDAAEPPARLLAGDEGRSRSGEGVDDECPGSELFSTHRRMSSTGFAVGCSRE